MDPFWAFVGNWGPETLLAAVVLLVVWGRLIPRRTVDKMLEEMRNANEVLVDVNKVTLDTNRTLIKQNKDLMEITRLALPLLQAIERVSSDRQEAP